MGTTTKTITIIYECDIYGNHDCITEELCETHTKLFIDKMEAVHFIGECTSCTSNIKEVHPELFFWENKEEQTINSNKVLEEFRINNNY
tara:strand:- start:28 stop:294 length:267 start_codon:yes stop_codon:yes gene_type:complete